MTYYFLNKRKQSLMIVSRGFWEPKRTPCLTENNKYCSNKGSMDSSTTPLSSVPGIYRSPTLE